jgi:hypothetical protein
MKISSTGPKHPTSGALYSHCPSICPFRKGRGVALLPLKVPYLQWPWMGQYSHFALLYICDICLYVYYVIYARNHRKYVPHINSTSESTMAALTMLTHPTFEVVLCGLCYILQYSHQRHLWWWCCWSCEKEAQPGPKVMRWRVVMEMSLILQMRVRSTTKRIAINGDGSVQETPTNSYVPSLHSWKQEMPATMWSLTAGKSLGGRCTQEWGGICVVGKEWPIWMFYKPT